MDQTHVTFFTPSTPKNFQTILLPIMLATYMCRLT
jgi:hypothetical protein